MGLDMYLYRVKKPEMKYVEGFIGKELSELDDVKGMALISLQDYEEEDYPLIQQLLPYCHVIEMTNRELLLGKIVDDYNVQGSIHIGEITKDYIGFYYSANDNINGERVSISISMNDIQNKYSHLENINVAVCYMDDVYYWRGDAGTHARDLFYQYIGCIKNCGYYKVPDDMIAELEACVGLELCKEEDEVFMYHEWY